MAVRMSDAKNRFVLQIDTNENSVGKASESVRNYGFGFIEKVHELCGDFVIRDFAEPRRIRAIIERKRHSDLNHSINDQKRYREQRDNMLAQTGVPHIFYFMVDTGCDWLERLQNPEAANKKLTSASISLCFKGKGRIHTIPVLGGDETVPRAIEKIMELLLVEEEDSEGDEERRTEQPVHQKKILKGNLDQASVYLAQLQAIRGISKTKAEGIRAKYPSMSKLIKGFKRGGKYVLHKGGEKKIGLKLSETIYKCIFPVKDASKKEGI